MYKQTFIHGYTSQNNRSTMMIVGLTFLYAAGVSSAFIFVCACVCLGASLKGKFSMTLFGTKGNEEKQHQGQEKWQCFTASGLLRRSCVCNLLLGFSEIGLADLNISVKLMSGLAVRSSWIKTIYVLNVCFSLLTPTLQTMKSITR